MATWKRKDNGNIEVVPDRLDNMMKMNPAYESADESSPKKKASASSSTAKENDK